MKVLVPLPFDISSMAHGRNLRIVHLLGELNKRCDLECITSDQQTANANQSVLPEVRITPANSKAQPANNPSTPTPASNSYWIKRALTFVGYDPHLLGQVLEQSTWADVLLGFDVPSVNYLLAVADQTHDRPRIIYDLIDDPWLTWQSLPIAQRFSPSSIKAAYYTQVIRRRLLSKFDALIAVAPRDATSLARASGVNATVVPNGVTVAEDPPAEHQREPLVVFTGAMNFPPNEAAACFFVRRIWPQVLKHLDSHSQNTHKDGPPLNARFAIVGANPTPKVKRLADARGVTVTGRVEDVSAWLKRARVAVAPMVSGCGIKNKVLEACAAGCPVVSSPLGAAALPTGKDNGIIVAPTNQQFSGKVAQLLTDSTAAKALGRAGWAMAKSRCSWSKSAETLCNVLAGNNQAAPSEAQVICSSSPWQQKPQQSRETLIHASS